jgi:inorganic triphosphatase YgiF
MESHKQLLRVRQSESGQGLILKSLDFAAGLGVVFEDV